MKRVLITGGAGFIGSKIGEYYASQGDSVLIYDNFLPQVHGNEASILNLKEKLTSFSSVVNGDMNDLEALSECIHRFKPEICFHMAAETGTGQSKYEALRYVSTNVQGTANLVSQLNRLDCFQKLIIPSSRSIYGEGAYCLDSKPSYGWTRKSEDMMQGRYGIYTVDGRELDPMPTSENAFANPCSLYASTKLMQEYITLQCEKLNNWKLGILRFQNVYGPGQSLKNPYTGVLSIFSEQILRDEKLNIYEDGKIARDFIYVDDVVSACVAMSSLSLPDGLVLNIGSGVSAYIKDVAEKLLVMYEKSPDNYYISGDFRDGDIRYACADISKAVRNLEWTPATSLEKGLSIFAEWVLKEIDRKGR